MSSLYPMAQIQEMEEGVEMPIHTDRLRRIFDKYDQNGDGRLEIHELKEIINSREYQHDIPETAVERILQLSDTDGNGHLDFDEFVKMVHDPRLHSIFGHFVTRYVHTFIPRRNPLGGRRGDTDVPDGLYEDEYSCWPPPVCMILISLIEIILFSIDEAHTDTEYADGPIAKVAIFDPKKREQAWRFVTYMFVHIGVLHLVVNLLVQLLLGVPLEMVHRGWRVLVIYFCGVLAGSLCTSVTDPHVKLAGASGGVYSLITAHIASVIMNWKEMQFALAQLLVFLTIAIIDCGTAIYNRYKETNDHIGYAAHLAGATAGLLVGIFILRNLEVNSAEKRLWWIALITFILLMTAAIVVNVASPSYFA